MQTLRQPLPGQPDKHQPQTVRRLPALSRLGVETRTEAYFWEGVTVAKLIFQLIAAVMFLYGLTVPTENIMQQLYGSMWMIGALLIAKP